MYLLEVNERPNVEILTVPAKFGAHSSMDSPFTILQFEGPEEEDILFRQDGQQQTVATEDVDEIMYYLKSFNTTATAARDSGSLEANLGRVLRDHYS
jgi:hypothetical protein